MHPETNLFGRPRINILGFTSLYEHANATVSLLAKWECTGHFMSGRVGSVETEQHSASSSFPNISSIAQHE